MSLKGQKLLQLYEALKKGKPLSEQLENVDELRKADPPPPPEQPGPGATAGPGEPPTPNAMRAPGMEGEFMGREEPPAAPPPPDAAPPVDPIQAMDDLPPATVDEAGEIVGSVGQPRPEEPTTNINFDRLETLRDIDALIDTAAKQTATPPRTTLSAIGKSAEKYTLKDIVGHDPVKQGIMMPEKAVAARNLLVELGEDLHAQATHIRDNSARITDQDLFLFRANVAKYRAVMDVVQGQTRLAGQLLGSFRVMAKNQGMVRDIAQRQVMDGLGGRQAALDIASMIAEQKDLKKVAKVAKESFLLRSVRAIEQIRYNSMLSGPETQIRNILGNAVAMLVRPATTAIAAGGGAVRRAVRPSSMAGATPSEQAVRFTESYAQLMGIISGATDGFNLAMRALKDPDYSVGIRKAEETMRRSVALSNSQWAQSNPIAKGLAFLTDVAFLNGALRGLGAMDSFFKAMAYQMEKNGLAVRQALNEGLSGDQFLARVEYLSRNMSEEHFIKAIDQMEMATFTNDLEGPFFQNMNKLLNRTPGVSFIIPFYRTLINLTSWTARHSVMAPLAPSFWRAMQRGGIDADKAIGQAVFGLMVYLPVAQMTASGKLTGSGAFLSEDTRRNWYAAGWRPNSYLGDDGVYHSIQGGAPFTTIALLYATLTEAVMFTDDDRYRTDVATGAAMLFADVVLDQTFASGLAQWLSVLTEPEDWKIRSMTTGQATSFMPNWLRWARRVVDADKRETKRTDPGDELMAKIFDRVPGLSDNLPPAVTFFGEPPAIGYDAMMVFPESDASPNWELFHHLDRNGIQMRKPPPVLRISGANIELDKIPDKRGEGYAYYQWQVHLGQARAKAVRRAINSPVFRNAPEGKAGDGVEGRMTRGDILQRAMSAARTDALQRMANTYSETQLERLIMQDLRNNIEQIRPKMPHVTRKMEDQPEVRF